MPRGAAHQNARRDSVRDGSLLASTGGSFLASAEVDGEFLLDSPDIREATFAILCKLTDPRAAIVHLGARIRLLTPEEQRVAIAHLLVLSGLRGLMEVVKEEISTMPLQIDIHENEFLDEIWHQGKDDEARENLLDLLDQRFGPITDVAILARIRTGGRADVKAWMRRVLDAPSVESIFR